MSCSLAYTEIDGMRAVVLENDLIRIGLLIDRGSDIYEFFYKPSNVDFLLRLNKGIRNPSTHFSQIRDSKRQFEDYYYGGWQVCLPNSPAFNYRGADLGQHGEVSLIPWQAKELEVSENKVSIECSTDVLRLPIRITRRFTLHKNISEIQIDEFVTNYGKTSLDIMWGQHIAFGIPFLEQGVVIDTNATTLEAESEIPEPNLIMRNKKFTWPNATSVHGESINVSKVSAANNDEKYSELAYLEGFPKGAYYKLSNKDVGFALSWDGSLFKSLWMWQERNAIQDFPWWGDCFTVALEPWTSRWTKKPEEAIAQGDWLTLTPGKTLSTSLNAKAFEPN